jgi:hypothetical protein
VGPREGTDPQESLILVADALRARGRCAWAWADAVAILGADGLWEEWHAVYFGNGGTITSYNAYKGAWPYGPQPTPTACGTPLPDRDPHNLKIAVKPHHKWVDATIQTVMTCEYCRLIGLGEYADGTPRCGCPMRAEGAPDRVACELYAAHGRPVWVADNGGEIVHNTMGPDDPTENPWQATCTDCTMLRVCSHTASEADTVCSAWIAKP